MPRITKVRSVLLSAAYPDSRDDSEVIVRIPSGFRTTGLVEITFDNGIMGLGKGYLAMFAPRVFEKILDLVTPALIGRELDDVAKRVRDVSLVTGSWSLQGAGQHVVSAVEIALQDCRARLQGVPVWKLLGGERTPRLKLYASGGDAVRPTPMLDELNRIRALCIDTVKIRAKNHQSDKTVWCQRHALGALDIENYAELRKRVASTRIAGGRSSPRRSNSAGASSWVATISRSRMPR